MKYRHYAPKADLTVVTGEKKDVIGTVNYLSHTGISQGKKIGIIATDETAGEYRCGDVISIGAREDEDAIARHLYGILRKLMIWMWIPSTLRALNPKDWGRQL